MTGYIIGLILGIIVIIWQNLKPTSAGFRYMFLIVSAALMWGIYYAHLGLWNILVIPVALLMLCFISAFCFPLFKMQDFKNLVANPIETINFEGCMGINLGDSWQFVLNRMLHLNLISKAKFKEYHDAYFEYRNDTFMEVGVGRFVIEEHFNNIQSLEFCVRNGVLNSIRMKFIGEHHDVNTIVEIVKNKLTRKFGTPMENMDGEHFFMWGDKTTGHLIILDDIKHKLLLSYSIV